MLPREHPGRGDLHRTKLACTGDPELQAEEFVDRTVAWVQTVLEREGGEPTLLDGLPPLDENLDARIERLRLVQKDHGGADTKQAAGHSIEAHAALGDQGRPPIARESTAARAAGACFYIYAVSRGEADVRLIDAAIAEAQTALDLGADRE
jgi:hypothetical protein